MVPGEVILLSCKVVVVKVTVAIAGTKIMDVELNSAAAPQPPLASALATGVQTSKYLYFSYKSG